MPFVERCPLPRLDPYSIYPCAVSAMYSQDPSLLGFIILDISVQSRNTLERAEVYVDLGGGR